MLKNFFDFSEADLYIYWQGFAGPELTIAISASLQENPVTALALKQVKAEAERWKFLELPSEPIAQWVIDDLVARIGWKYIPAAESPEFGQVWSLKEIENRFVVLVYVDEDILRAIPISDQIQNATRFDLVIDTEYLPHEFHAKQPAVKSILEAWHDFPLLRSHLGKHLGSLSNKTCKLLNDLLVSYELFEIGADDYNYPGYINNPELFGHATGMQSGDDVADFQLAEVEIFYLDCEEAYENNKE